MRRALGPHYLRHLRLFLGEDLDGIGLLRSAAAAHARRCRSASGSRRLPSLSLFVYEGERNPVTRAARAPAGDAGLRLHRRAARRRSRRPRRAGAGRRRCRCSTRCSATRLLREHAEAAARLLGGADRPAASCSPTPSSSTSSPLRTRRATWSWQRQPAGARRRARRARSASTSRQLTDFSAPEVRSLGEFREALARARRRPTRRRSSACCRRCSTPPPTGSTPGSPRSPPGGSPRSAPRQPTGLLHRRLRLAGEPPLRARRRRRRAAAGRARPADRRRPTTPGSSSRPSLTQASTAALLRNAHLAHGGGDDSPYAIKLTSDRVRLAERLFDGVRQGQPARRAARLRRRAPAPRGRPRRVHRRPAARSRPARGGRRRGGRAPARARRAGAARASGATHPGRTCSTTWTGSTDGDPRRERARRACWPGSTRPSTPPPTR